MAQPAALVELAIGQETWGAHRPKALRGPAQQDYQRDDDERPFDESLLGDYSLTENQISLPPKPPGRVEKK